jgi:hypothetical protein
LGNPVLPSPGAVAEILALKVPVIPGQPQLAAIYLLMEYRMRVGPGEHPDNFTVDLDSLMGDKTTDPGYNPANPAASHYINPPAQFVSKEGVLVYLVNEKIPHIPTVTYKPEEWYKFPLILLNPAGHAQRDDLTQVALAGGERMEVDFRSLYASASVPIKITVVVNSISKAYADVTITRERL